MIELPEDFEKSLAELSSGEDMAAAIKDSLPTVKNDKHDAKSIAKLLELIQKLEKMEAERGTQKWFEAPYSIDLLPKHKAFFDASASYNEVLFMAGNRVGKSVAGAYALTCHLTGDYPSWWNGKVFDHPIKAWAIGKDARAVRDTLQKELLGSIGEWGTGMIPASRLGKFFALQGTPQAIDIIKIKHKSGGWSELGFKNYQQDIGSFMGTERHVVLCDEEVPLDIYNECNIRTATTKGLMLLTFTPLDGLTPLVVNFCKRADYLVGTKPLVAMDQEETLEDQDGENAVGFSTSKAVIQAGWDDVPWLDPETKKRLLDDTPMHLREARSKGLPSQGAGNVFPTALDTVVIPPFALPESWPRMYGMDVGWNRTAVIWGALDPATDTLYVYDEHYMGQELPSTHAYAVLSRGKWIKGAIDPASRGRSQIDGRKLIQEYKDLGLLLHPANNEVEAGILAINQRLGSGKLKIFSTCVNLQKEYQLYRRDKHGKVLKENDHALDAFRYVVNNMTLMSSKADHEPVKLKYTAKQYRV